MGKKSKGEFKYELIEIIDVLEESGNWAKVLMKVSWNGNPPTLDIRNVDMRTIHDEKVKFGSGITLSDDACIRLAKNLMELGCLDYDDIEDYESNRDIIFKKEKKKVKVKRIDKI